MKKLVSKRNLIVILLSLIFLSLFIAVVITASSIGDFKIYLGAGRLVKLHHNIYDIIICGNKYFYSPLFALLLIPFSYLPNYIPTLMWICCDIIWLARIWKLIEQRFDLRSFTNKEKNILVFCSFLMTFRFLHYDLALAQMSVFMLWSILESISLAEKGKALKCSLLLALAINIKLLPLVILPYFIFRKHFRIVFLTVVFFIIFLYLPAIFIGIDYNNYLLHQWWGVINPLRKEHMVETDSLLHGLTALVPSLLMKTTGELEMKRNIIDLAPDVVYAITNIVRMIFIIWTFYFIGFKHKKDTLQLLWETSYIIMLIPLIFPHQQKYAFLLLLPASAYLVYFLISTFKNEYRNIGKLKWTVIICLISFSFILMTLTTDGLIGRHYCDITQYYKTITYGAIIMIIALSICQPKYISEIISTTSNDLK